MADTFLSQNNIKGISCQPTFEPDIALCRYISRPLLINRRKFHIRAYVLCVGSLSVYVYSESLALFAGKEYDRYANPFWSPYINRSYIRESMILSIRAPSLVFNSFFQISIGRLAREFFAVLPRMCAQAKFGKFGLAPYKHMSSAAQQQLREWHSDRGGCCEASL